MRYVKKILLSLLLLFSGHTTTLWADNSFAIATGKANSDLNVLRVAARKTWSSQWFASSMGVLSGFHSFSVNHWWDNTNSISAVAYSPVFAYQFRDTFISYAVLGVGVSYFSDSQVKDRDLGSRFQFEDRLGVGWQWASHDLSLVYMHYSNAGIEAPNEGLDMLLLSYAFIF